MGFRGFYSILSNESVRKSGHPPKAPPLRRGAATEPLRHTFTGDAGAVARTKANGGGVLFLPEARRIELSEIHLPCGEFTLFRRPGSEGCGQRLAWYHVGYGRRVGRSPLKCLPWAKNPPPSSAGASTSSCPTGASNEFGPRSIPVPVPARSTAPRLRNSQRVGCGLRWSRENGRSVRQFGLKLTLSGKAWSSRAQESRRPVWFAKPACVSVPLNMKLKSRSSVVRACSAECCWGEEVCHRALPSTRVPSICSNNSVQKADLPQGRL